LSQVLYFVTLLLQEMQYQSESRLLPYARQTGHFTYSAL
jgi:hypothetical protein